MVFAGSVRNCSFMLSGLLLFLSNESKRNGVAGDFSLPFQIGSSILTSSDVRNLNVDVIFVERGNNICTVKNPEKSPSSHSTSAIISTELNKK